jgi:hypothetical protein
MEIKQIQAQMMKTFQNRCPALSIMLPIIL